MPTDSRRNQGPVSCESYRLYSTLKPDYVSRISTIINELGERTDKRKQNDHRKVFLKTGVVTQAKGSAYVEYNRTKVIVSVFDPREIPRLSEFSPNGELFCEFKFAPFSCEDRRSHVMDSEEKDMSVILKRALEPSVCRHEFPNFQVDIYALVLENDGSCLSAAITGAGLALADACIPMYDVITSVSLGIHDKLIFIDPNYEEEKLCKTSVVEKDGTGSEFGLITLSYMDKDEQITEITQTGALQSSKITESLDILIKNCVELSLLVKQCLAENVKLNLQENEETD